MSKKLTSYSFYEWSELRELVEAESGRSLIDWDGKIEKSRITEEDYRSGNYPAAIWARSMGYNWEVLDDIHNADGTITQRTGADIELRSKINTEFRENNEEEYPDSKDFCNYLFEEVVFEVNNGCIFTLNPKELLSDLRKEESRTGVARFEKEVLKYFIKVMKDNNLPDEINIHYYW